jgi:pimeloyl-ACP methyl ester carboxylesterase
VTPVRTADGYTLHAESDGSGPAILFLHEFAGDHRMWAEQVAALRGEYRCITFAARGYPPSDVPPDQSAYSHVHATDDAIAVLDAFRVHRAHVVGLSMGGFTALQLGIRYPDRVFSLLVSSAGSGASPHQRAEFLANAQATAEAFRHEGTPAVADRMALGPARIQLQRKNRPLWERFRTQLAEHSAEGMAFTVLGVQRARPSLWEIVDELRTITTPTLVLNGDEDEAVLDAGLLLKRTIASAGLQIVPNSGHLLNLEDPELYTQIVRAFVQAAAAGTWPQRDPRSLAVGGLGGGEQSGPLR